MPSVTTIFSIEIMSTLKEIKYYLNSHIINRNHTPYPTLPLTYPTPYPTQPSTLPYPTLPYPTPNLSYPLPYPTLYPTQPYLPYPTIHIFLWSYDLRKSHFVHTLPYTLHPTIPYPTPYPTLPYPTLPYP